MAQLNGDWKTRLHATYQESMHQCPASGGDAADFLAFLAGPEGRAIFERAGFPVLATPTPRPSTTQ
jgi:hypothetical protein